MLQGVTKNEAVTSAWQLPPSTELPQETKSAKNEEGDESGSGGGGVIEALLQAAFGNCVGVDTR
jgi:hypothetical protein